MTGTPLSRLAVLGVLVVIVAFAFAAILLVSDTDSGTQRLGLFLALVGTVVAGLLTVLRSDQAATQTNGKLDARIHAAVMAGLDARRRGDPPPEIPTGNVMPPDA
jgi:hypothetical protein